MQELLERRRKLMEDFNAFRQRTLRELEQKRQKYIDCKLHSGPRCDGCRLNVLLRAVLLSLDLRDVEEFQAAEAQLEEVSVRQEVREEKVDG